MSDLLRESIKRNYFRGVKQLLVKNISVSNPEEYEWDEKEKKNINRQLKGLYTLHSTLYTLDFSLYTLHSTL